MSELSKPATGGKGKRKLPQQGADKQRVSVAPFEHPRVPIDRHRQWSNLKSDLMKTLHKKAIEASRKLGMEIAILNTVPKAGGGVETMVAGVGALSSHVFSKPFRDELKTLTPRIDSAGVNVNQGSSTDTDDKQTAGNLRLQAHALLRQIALSGQLGYSSASFDWHAATAPPNWPSHVAGLSWQVKSAVHGKLLSSQSRAIISWAIPQINSWFITTPQQFAASTPAGSSAADSSSSSAAMSDVDEKPQLQPAELPLSLSLQPQQVLLPPQMVEFQLQSIGLQQQLPLPAPQLLQYPLQFAAAPPSQLLPASAGASSSVAHYAAAASSSAAPSTQLQPLSLQQQAQQPAPQLLQFQQQLAVQSQGSAGASSSAQTLPQRNLRPRATASGMVNNNNDCSIIAEVQMLRCIPALQELLAEVA
jgi:hypothetical protein